MAVCIENNVNGRFLAACYTLTLYMHYAVKLWYEQNLEPNSISKLSSLA